MTFPSLLSASALAVSLACSADTATQQNSPEQVQLESPQQRSPVATAAVVPENAGDRSIRRELTLALGRDEALHDREISFIVSNGDVSVTGTVRTETERQRINDLAMGIPGVKSVANG